MLLLGLGTGRSDTFKDRLVDGYPFPKRFSPFPSESSWHLPFQNSVPSPGSDTAFPVRHWHRAEWHLTPDQSLDFKIKSRTEFKMRKQCGEEIVSPRDLSHGGVSEDSICNV